MFIFRIRVKETINLKVKCGRTAPRREQTPSPAKEKRIDNFVFAEPSNLRSLKCARRKKCRGVDFKWNIPRRKKQNTGNSSSLASNYFMKEPSISFTGKKSWNLDKEIHRVEKFQQVKKKLRSPSDVPLSPANLFSLALAQISQKGVKAADRAANKAPIKSEMRETCYSCNAVRRWIRSPNGGRVTQWPPVTLHAAITFVKSFRGLIS